MTFRCTIEFLDILGARLNSQETSEPTRQKMGIIRQCIETIMQTRMAKCVRFLGGQPNRWGLRFLVILETLRSVFSFAVFMK